MGIRDEIIFDTEDKENLLDPRICRGEEVVPCIMRYLGVNKRLLDNPIVEEYLRDTMKQILENREDRLVKILNGEKEPELRENEEIARIIKIGTNAEYKFIFMSSIFTPNIQRDFFLDTDGKKDISSSANKHSNKAVQLKVNNEGNVTMMVWDLETERKEEKIIYTDLEGNPVINVRETMSKEPNSIIHITTTRFDRYGIEMKKEEDGIKTTERIPQYPFAARQIYLGDENLLLPDLNTKYIILSDYANLQGGEMTFNNMQELEAYYNENRTEIAHKFLKSVKPTAGLTRRSAKQINLRLKAIAYQAGIIGNGEVTRN